MNDLRNLFMLVCIQASFVVDLYIEKGGCLGYSTSFISEIRYLNRKYYEGQNLNVSYRIYVHYIATRIVFLDVVYKVFVHYVKSQKWLKTYSTVFLSNKNYVLRKSAKNVVLLPNIPCDFIRLIEYIN